jgi:hypothetical protein
MLDMEETASLAHKIRTAKVIKGKKRDQANLHQKIQRICIDVLDILGYIGVLYCTN